MTTFLAGVWHGLKVISAALYWLVSFCLGWAGFAQMGTAPSWGWACLGFVIALFVARGLVSPRFVTSGLSYVLACGAIIAFLVFAAVATGYQIT